MKKFLLLGLFSIAFLPFLAWAQVGNLNQDVSINTIPRYPEPNSEVSVLLDAYTIDTTGATIGWYIDGVEQPEYRNLRELKMTTKGLGEISNVEVRIKMRTGPQIARSLNIRPSRIDVTIEANTLTPAFYKGRALPTVGSKARIIAIPHTGRPDKPDEFTYIWKHDNKVLFGGPIKGHYIAEIEMGMGREQTITVDAIDKNGINVARKSIVVEPAEPEVLFYEENPLRGASQKAAEKPFFMIDQETTLRAEPYYMSADIFDTEHVVEWTINGRRVNNQSSDPLYITLNRGISASANLGFHIRNLKQLLQGVKAELPIQF